MTNNSTVPLSVIVPVYKGDENFLQCMESLTATCPKPDEIIIVIDGHLDSSFYPDKQQVTSILHTSSRGGPGMARNIGAKAAQNDILLFIDSDVLVPPTLLEKVMEEFKEHPDISGIFGSYDNTPQAKISYRNTATSFIIMYTRTEMKMRQHSGGRVGLSKGMFFSKTEGLMKNVISVLLLKMLNWVTDSKKQATRSVSAKVFKSNISNDGALQAC